MDKDITYKTWTDGLGKIRFEYPEEIVGILANSLPSDLGEYEYLTLYELEEKRVESYTRFLKVSMNNVDSYLFVNMQHMSGIEMTSMTQILKSRYPQMSLGDIGRVLSIIGDHVNRIEPVVDEHLPVPNDKLHCEVKDMNLTQYCLESGYGMVKPETDPETVANYISDAIKEKYGEGAAGRTQVMKVPKGIDPREFIKEMIDNGAFKEDSEGRLDERRGPDDERLKEMDEASKNPGLHLASAYMRLFKLTCDPGLIGDTVSKELKLEVQFTGAIAGTISYSIPLSERTPKEFTFDIVRTVLEDLVSSTIKSMDGNLGADAIYRDLSHDEQPAGGECVHVVVKLTDYDLGIEMDPMFLHYTKHADGDDKNTTEKKKNQTCEKILH